MVSHHCELFHRYANSASGPFSHIWNNRMVSHHFELFHGYLSLSEQPDSGAPAPQAQQAGLQ